MADEDVVQDGKKSGKLKWIIIAVALILLGVGGYFGYTMFFAPSDDAQTAERGGSADPLPDSLEGQLVPLPTFLVNLADPLGRRYLKLGIEVEVRDKKVASDLLRNEARIRDTLLLLLSSKSYDSLSTMKAKVEMKQEIVDRLNQILGRGTVLRVYITEMVIQ
ncbi:flagellar basal body-associated FliL family protein [Pseudodesulfovibrio pelocollis]|uniref:flagellar basal body-associated FliL family protein n=1 Tax=Pseudodesulfovibrio pelocollis TaxID=3051432 RepID=UPI00255AD466|nr:flagellar basal body-associated FliL family protein [Pseudodesulfovibrio sp. SB368]